MKNKLFLFFVLSFLSIQAAWSQSNNVILNIPKDTIPIVVRDWPRSQYVVVNCVSDTISTWRIYDKTLGGGTSPATYREITFPPHTYINDIKVVDNYAFFVGVQDTNIVIGMLNLLPCLISNSIGVNMYVIDS